MISMETVLSDKSIPSGAMTSMLTRSLTNRSPSGWKWIAISSAVIAGGVSVGIIGVGVKVTVGGGGGSVGAGDAVGDWVWVGGGA